MNHNEQGRVKLTALMTTGATKQTAFHWRQKQVRYKYLFEVFLRSRLGTVTREIYGFYRSGFDKSGCVAVFGGKLIIGKVQHLRASGGAKIPSVI